MIIQGAALVNRFYISDGWTREGVAKLLKRPLKLKDKIKCVTLRYFNDYTDGTIGEVPTYYAVYQTEYPDAIFDKEKILEHKYEPFTHVKRHRTIMGMKSFGGKNKWE